jgi:hypothetical protein
LLATLQRAAQRVEKRVHELFGFTLVQANLLKQPLCHLCFGQRHVTP